MVVCRQIPEIKKALQEVRKENKSVGLVPTMGALHRGHLSLLEAARKENDVVVASIFVNPIQFNNPEDFRKYPQDLENDMKTLETGKCDLVFNPGQSEIYPDKVEISLKMNSYEQYMEGFYRPGHFNGVAIVVMKLFNIINPDRAYFGQKDLQQAAIVNRIVRDFSYGLEVKVITTVRESDGLAASSRNRLLSKSQRSKAPLFYKALLEARDILKNGGDVNHTKQKVNNLFAQSSGIRLEYFEIVDSDTMLPVKDLNFHKRISLCIAGFVGEIRLLDNIYL